MGTVKYSGPVASFHCPTEATIRSLKVHFSPKQLGEGTPSPENVREIEGWDGVTVQQSGINLFNPDTEWFVQGGRYYSRFVNNDKALFRMDLIEKNTTADVSGCFIGFALDPSNIELGYCWALRNGTIRPVTNRTNRAGTKPLQYLSIYPSTIETLTKILARYDVRIVLNDIPETTPFKPYQGFSTTNYEFGVLGKNKFNQENEVDNVYVDTNGDLIPYTASSWNASDFIKVSSNTVYTFNPGSVDGTLAKHCYYDKDKNFISYIDSGLQTFTTPNNAEYMRFSYRGSDTPMLELGSFATTYEPYDPNKTVYGGWVDLVTGEVQKTFEYVELSTLYWRYRNGVFDGVVSDGSLKGRYNLADSKAYSNFKKQVAKVYTVVNADEMLFGASYANNTTCSVIIKESDYTSVNSDFIAYLSGKYLAYEVNIPVTYHLAPTQLQTFLGQNNVWSNADYVEVEYDLHETQNILARKQFIVASQPHIVKPAAAPLQNFVTDMVAPLKECKVYFSPKQAGEGDPSPDNVRAISGWTGVEVYHRGKNLWHTNFTNNDGSFQKADGVFTKANAGTSSTSYLLGSGTAGVNQIMYIIPAGTYTMTASSETFTNIFVTLSDGNLWYSGQTRTFAQDVYILNVRCTSINLTQGTYYWSMQIELGPTATAYEPYQGQTIALDWSDSAGTVYGGNVDLITGKVWQTWGGITLDGSQNAYISGSGYRGTNCTDVWFDAGSDKWGYNTSYAEMLADSYCDSLVLTLKAIWGYPDLYPWAYVLNSYNQIHCVFDNSTVGITSDDTNAQAITKVKSWLASHPITVKYRLSDNKSTSVTDLTPTVLKTLRGTNNIWSNANGDIDLTYWKH